MSALKEFFTLNLADYENIGVDLLLGTFLAVFTCLFIAVSFLYTYSKISTVTLMCALIRRDALNEESALTLSDLRLCRSFGVKYALSGKRLQRLLGFVGFETPSYEEFNEKGSKKEKPCLCPDLKTTRIYIPDDSLSAARRIAEERVTYITPVILSVIAIAALVALVFTLPDLIELLNLALAE